jgi:hypothetical protein
MVPTWHCPAALNQSLKDFLSKILASPDTMEDPFFKKLQLTFNAAISLNLQTLQTCKLQREKEMQDEKKQKCS